MKKILIPILMLVGLMLSGPRLQSGPAEKFNKCDEITVTASMDTFHIFTTAGAPFRCKKVTVISTPAANNGNDITVTFYVPPSKGPGSAEDSIVLMTVVTSSGNWPGQYDFYGPASDTVRVVSGAFAAGLIIGYSD